MSLSVSGRLWLRMNTLPSSIPQPSLGFASSPFGGGPHAPLLTYLPLGFSVPVCVANLSFVPDGNEGAPDGLKDRVGPVVCAKNLTK